MPTRPCNPICSSPSRIGCSAGRCNFTVTLALLRPVSAVTQGLSPRPRPRLQTDHVQLIKLPADNNETILLLTLGAHARSVVVVCVCVCVCVCMCVCVCVCVCVTTHNCRLTHWNHKTEIPTCSQQYSDRFKFCRFS